MSQINRESFAAKEIMTPYVVLLDDKARLKDIINLLDKHKISAVFIHNKDDKDYYIVTKTDIINYLNNGGMNNINLGEISIKTIMKGPIELIDAKTPIDKIIRFLIDNNYKRTLISENGKAIGVVSTKDIMKFNNTYFKPAKPQILLFMDNFNSTFIAKHIYKENLEDDISPDLIDIYGGALTSISIITNHIIKKSGAMRQLIKDRRSIILEKYKGITGILISDYNSLDLKQKLYLATREFYRKHEEIIENSHNQETGISLELEINSVVPIFKEENDRL
ncbi:MAG: CBS domain-containing protein [Candidatus Lokiarchaeota archaeon]|nr:CBS domain-containing protein [Candidatus Lokiarchaeota archaeon]